MLDITSIETEASKIMEYYIAQIIGILLIVKTVKILEKMLWKMKK